MIQTWKAFVGCDSTVSFVQVPCAQAKSQSSAHSVLSNQRYFYKPIIE